VHLYVMLLWYRGLDGVVGLDGEVEHRLRVGETLGVDIDHAVTIDGPRGVTIDVGHTGHRELDVVDQVGEVVVHVSREYDSLLSRLLVTFFEGTSTLVVVLIVVVVITVNLVGSEYHSSSLRTSTYK